MVDSSKARQSRLGRGLSSLIGEVEAIAPAGSDAADSAPSAQPSELPISAIQRNPSQPRQVFDEEAMAELEQSIRTKGVLQPILVRPDPKAPGKYQIVAGERRWRAARAAGLESMPAVVKDLDELELLEIGIIENVQRTDLNAMEEAEAYAALMKRFGRTQESLAESVGKSRVHITNTLRLLKLPESVREHVRHGRLNAGQARALLGAPDPAELAEQVIAKGLSARDAEALSRLAKAGEGGGIKVRAPGEKPAKDIDTQALEADLGRTLGLAVDIRHGANGGELRVRYRTLEQLDDVCRKLTAKR